MKGTEVVKIFFPQCLLNASSGVCLGIVDTATKSICIVAIVHPSEGQNIALKDASSHRTFGFHVVGTYKNVFRFCTESSELNGGDGCFMIAMEQRHHNEIPSCKIIRSPWQHREDPCETSTFFILFNELHAINARHMTLHDGQEIETTIPSGATGPSSSVLKELPSAISHRCEAVEFLFSAVQHFQTMSHALYASGTTPGSCIRMDDRSKGWHWFRQLCRHFFVLPFFFFRILFICLDAVGKLRVFQSDNLLHRILTFPVTGSQLAIKSHQFCDFMRMGNCIEGSSLSQGRRSSNPQFIRIGNSFTTLFVDLLLGLMLLLLMYHSDVPILFAGIVRKWADHTGTGLQHLLHWLMGAPAGLKLNTFLAHFLGNFFLYHVYLWIGYLSVLLPIMTALLWCIAGAGILGLSVQLALASDLLSVLTFHIYCFYVYAARIYNLQVSGLLSLARLFQGKKWNVLRQRVDSCSYDVDQLFMGTLLFTMLFFMLPTTALFYVVFTSLRMLVLFIQSLLTLIRELLHTFPWFSLLLWLLGSDMLNQGIQFQLLPTSPWQPTALSLQMQLMTLQEALQAGQRSSLHLKPQKLSVFLMFQKLVRGQLIYPWGGEHS